MGGVDVSVLDCNEVLDHLVGRGETVVKDKTHNFVYSHLKILETLKFWHVKSENNTSEFFIDHLNALERWLL